MTLFKKANTDLKKLEAIAFKTEKEMQTITENNLEEIFDLNFVGSEIQLRDLRIDTLAFDAEVNAFIIIEFKNTRNYSVIDQGYAYLSLLLNNKAEFILEYNENKDKTLNRGDIDWSQSKIIFMAPEFTKHQKQAMGFQNIPFELWEIKRYDNNLINYNKLSVFGSRASIETISRDNENVDKVSREIKVYDEEYHLEGKPAKIEELYEVLKNRILNFGEDITIKPRKHYIGFKKDSNFVDIHLQKSQIKLWLNLEYGSLEDPREIARDMSDIGHWGNGDYEIKIGPDDDLDYLMTLIKQSYKKA